MLIIKFQCQLYHQVFETCWYEWSGRKQLCTQLGITRKKQVIWELELKCNCCSLLYCIALWNAKAMIYRFTNNTVDTLKRQKRIWKTQHMETCPFLWRQSMFSGLDTQHTCWSNWLFMTAICALSSFRSFSCSCWREVIMFSCCSLILSIVSVLPRANICAFRLSILASAESSCSRICRIVSMFSFQKLWMYDWPLPPIL